jgi:integrase
MAAKQSNGVYYMDAIIDGQRIKQSLKTRNKAEANKREAELLVKFQREALLRKNGIEPPPEQKPAPIFKNFYEETFLPWAEDEYKTRQRTLRSLKDRMAKVMEFDDLANVKVDAFTEGAFDRFKASLVARSFKGRTINRTMGALRQVVFTARRWSNGAGYKVYVPEFPKRAKEQLHKRVLSDEEERAYRAACPTRKHEVFFVLLIETGIEPGYAAAARWENVNLDGDEDCPGGWIFDPCAKNEYRSRDIPMTPELRAEIMKWWLEQGRPAAGWVFPAEKKGDDTQDTHVPLHSFHTTHKRMFGKSLSKSRGRGKRSRIMKHLTKEYAVRFIEGKDKGKPISYFRLYDLRHTCLTRLGRKGFTAEYLMKFAGWSTTRMASNYIHLTKRDVAAAIARLDSAIAVAGD